MVASSKVRTNLPNAAVDGALLRAGADLTANVAAGVVNTPLGGIIRHVRLKLTSVVVPVTAALDYGSIKLADLPDGNIIFLGGIAHLTIVKTSIDTTSANIDVGVGTAAASNVTLATTMINLIPKIDSTSGLVANGAASSTEAAKVFATSNTDVFLNVSAATTVDGSADVSGTIDLFYLDLGNQA